MKLSVIIPCYNEGRHIARVLDAVTAVDIPKEIIVVDDGSTDDTLALVKEHNVDGSIVIHELERNSGKGAAIRAGLEHVTGDIVIIQDADMEYDPKQYPDMIGPFEDPEVQVVYGSRFLGDIRGMRFQNRLGNHFLTWAVNVLFRAKITDEATCYKAFRTDLIKSLPLKCTGFEFCPEVTALILKRGISIREIPISYVGRGVAEGKKVKWTDALVAIWTLAKYKFTA